MFREENHYKEQKKLLPTREDVSIKNQFGFRPLSIIKPNAASKEKWKCAYFDDGEFDIRKNYHVYKQGQIVEAKMSEFHAGMAEHIIRYWSMPGAKVVDPFAGRATRAVVTTMLDRDYYGYEITPKTYARNIEHFKKLEINPTLYNSDGTLLSETNDNFADMIFTCPPYFNIEKYESVEGQLSDIKTYDSFMDMIRICAQNCFRVSKPGSFCVWVVGDFRVNGNLCDFHGDTTKVFKEAGYDYHDIIIMENISPFALFTQYQSACKRYAPKTHEYVLVFRKPGEYIIPDYCYDSMTESEKAANKFFEF